MPLTSEQRAKLERLGLSEVRLHYANADLHDYRSTLTTLDGLPRADVGAWIAEKEPEAEAKADRAHARTLRWAQIAAWIGAVGVIVTIILALLGK